MNEIDYAALDAAERAENDEQRQKPSPRVRAAVKSTAERVEEAAAALEKLQAQLADERELAVLRAAYAVQHGAEAKKSMKRTALIDALAESFGIA